MSSAPATAQRSRLTPAEVAYFQREGYFCFHQPVFAPDKFARLRAHFEDKLSRLPPDVRPEGMDVPHFTDPKLFEWLLADEVLDLVEPLLGPDIALFSSHFICKPKGVGKRVPWHEDSYYWRGMMAPMQVVTIWLAIDPATVENGCMQVIPRTQHNGYSDYDEVDPKVNVFHIEIKKEQRDESQAVACTLAPNECSLHDAKLIHGSRANTSDLRRCGYTMRYMPASVKLSPEANKRHLVYTARGRNLAGNPEADPTKSYDHLARYRELHSQNGH